jgi:hypothetical protein
MSTLTHQRCHNHAGREAVAQCPGCRQFFCRECVTEHDDRLLCASCLAKLARQPLTRRPIFVQLLRLAQGALGLLVAWFFFFLVGQTLISLPDSFHEGTLWRVPVTEQE